MKDRFKAFKAAAHAQVRVYAGVVFTSLDRHRVALYGAIESLT